MNESPVIEFLPGDELQKFVRDCLIASMQAIATSNRGAGMSPAKIATEAADLAEAMVLEVKRRSS